MGSWGTGIFDNDAAADLIGQVTLMGRERAVDAADWDWAWALVGVAAWYAQTPERCGTSLLEETLALAVVLAELRETGAWERVHAGTAPATPKAWHSARMRQGRPAALDAWLPPLLQALLPVAKAQHWRTPEMAREAMHSMRQVLALWPAVPDVPRVPAVRRATREEGAPPTAPARPVIAPTEDPFSRLWATLWATGQHTAALGLWRIDPAHRCPAITPEMLAPGLQSIDAAVRAATIRLSAVAQSVTPPPTDGPLAPRRPPRPPRRAHGP